MSMLKRTIPKVLFPSSPTSLSRSHFARRFCLGIFANCLVALTLVSGPRAATAQFVPSDFQFVASHFLAERQPTARGRTFWALHHYQGALYPGYGDWDTNTGPIGMSHWDLTTEDWSHEIFFNTEAVEIYREIGGTLYAPNIDPTGSRGGLAFNTPGPTGDVWAEHNTTPATHAFDVATLDGLDLWMTGSLDLSGMIWRSTDGGFTWQTIREDGPASGSFSRYYGAGVLDGKLYVQRRDTGGSHVANSLVYDGVNWIAGPDMLSQGGIYVWKPIVFGNELVYLSQSNSLGDGGLLYRFDGISAEQTYFPFTGQTPFGRPLDYVIADDTLFTLTSNREVIATTDLENWNLMGYAPSSSYSLAVVGNLIYVGTNNSEILSVQFIPEPNSIMLLLCAVAAMATHRERSIARRLSLLNFQ